MKNIFIILFLCVSPILSKPKGSRIIGGTEAFAGQFPFAAAIYKSTADGNYFCTGSLFHRQWVITAGQCVDGAVLFTILFGTHKLSGDEASVQRVATDFYVLHEDYNPLTLEHDLGLIKLRMPVTTSIYVSQLHLPPADLSYVGGRTFGWGQISDDDPTLSDTLNYVPLETVSPAECKLVYGDQIRDNMVCYAGNFNEGTCFGDSGSPVIQDFTQGYTIIKAIASFFSSNGCESADPSGYTNVFPYTHWINNATSQYTD